MRDSTMPIDSLPTRSNLRLNIPETTFKLTYNSDDLESCDSSHDSENSVYSDDSVPSSTNCEKIIDLDHHFQNTCFISNKCEDIIEKLTNLRVLTSDSETETPLASTCKKSNRIQEEVENFRNKYENLKNANSSSKYEKINYLNIFNESNDALSDKEKNNSKDLTTDTDDDDDLVARAPTKTKSYTSALKPYDKLSNGLERKVKEIYADDNNRIRIDTSLNILLAEDWRNSKNDSNYADISDKTNIQFNEPNSNMNNLFWNCSSPVQCEVDSKINCQANEEYHDTRTEKCPFTVIDIASPLSLQSSDSRSPANSLTTSLIPNNSLQIVPDCRVPQGPASSSSMISYTSSVIQSPSNFQNIIDSPIYEPLFTEHSQSEINSKLRGTTEEDTINLNGLDFSYLWPHSMNEIEKADTYSGRSSVNNYSNDINETCIPCEIGNDTYDEKNRMSIVSHNSLMHSNEQSSNCTKISGFIEKTQSNLSERILQWTKEDLPSFLVNSSSSSERSSTPIPPFDRSFLSVHTNMSKYISNTNLNIPYGQQLTSTNSPAPSTVSSPTPPVGDSTNVISKSARSWSTPKYTKILPRPVLDLPLTDASKRLSEGIDEQDEYKAMLKLLLVSKQYLTSSDDEKYTQLMLLVRDSNFLKSKRNRAYLIPLIERIGDVQDNLLAKNDYGEDALYLAAINCYEIPYVAGYLGAAMVKRQIDISKIVYHTKGDTIIHAVAAKGDTHINVLSELLSLKTNDNNSVFDLTKCNYDGKTALHMAVEAHKTSKPRTSSIDTVLLLLNRGADPKIKEAMHGNTALHLAVSLSCDPNLIHALLSCKGSEAINIRNYNGNTPVHLAAMSEVSPVWQREVCRYLILYKGLTNIRNHQGRTPLALVSPDRRETIKKIFHQKM